MDSIGKRTFLLGFILAAVTVIACGAWQKAGGQKSVADSKMPPAEPAALWTYITETDSYQQWKPYPAKGKEGLYAALERGRTPAMNPHGAYMKFFSNEIALRGAQQDGGQPMPEGTILVMENYDKDKKTLLSVTVMYKIKEFDPEHGDWFWGIYAPDGKAGDSGKVKSCTDCHVLKKSHDWIFAGGSGHGHHE